MTGIKKVGVFAIFLGHIIKCVEKNVTHSKFKSAFTQEPNVLGDGVYVVVLMSTTKCEKESLLGQLVLGKIHF